MAPHSKRTRSDEDSDSVDEGYSRHRNFIFTLNNYTEEDELAAQQLKCRYVVFGYERAPTTGTPHLQGFVSFKDACTLTAASKRLKRASFKIANTVTEAIDYCKKDGEYFERGDPPKDPKQKGIVEKERWKRIREACENLKYAELPDDYVCRHPGNVGKIRHLFLATTVPSDLDKLENYWYFGPSGSGKSLAARKYIRELSHSYYLKDLTKWWDYYAHQDVVLIEEIGPQHIPALTELLKKWADYYVFPAECKCGYYPAIRPKKIIVTSNFSIDELFNTAMDRDPINRRFNVVEFTL